MKKRAIREAYSDADLQASDDYLQLTSPNAEYAARQREHFRQQLAEEDGHLDYFAELGIIWLLAHRAGFYVDWKDDESFRGFVEELAHDWGVAGFAFPPEFETPEGEPYDVPALMHWGRNELARHGLLLWQWNTEEDNYCGAISREEDWPEIVRVCAQLGVTVLPGDLQFGIDDIE